MHFYHILIFIAFSSVLYYNKSNEITWNFILSCNTIRRILMNEKGLTNISLKKINKSKVYQYIYKNRVTSKLQIVSDLQMGLSTVSQNLNLLEQEGLIERSGYFDSTGGR